MKSMTKARIRIRIRIRIYLCLKSVSSTSSPSLTSWFQSRLRPSREKIPPEIQQKTPVKIKNEKSASNSQFQRQQLFSGVRCSSVGSASAFWKSGPSSILGSGPFSCWAKKRWGYKKTDLGKMVKDEWMYDCTVWMIVKNNANKPLIILNMTADLHFLVAKSNRIF